jgi:hypothetical protein
VSTFTFGPNFTWRKAGFLFLSNSLAYRDVLNANPEWDITSSPPPGSTLVKPNSSGVGGLNMAPITTQSFPSPSPETYYPFDSRDEYILAVIRYSPSALKSVEKCNGYSSTSSRVLSDLG